MTVLGAISIETIRDHVELSDGNSHRNRVLGRMPSLEEAVEAVRPSPSDVLKRTLGEATYRNVGNYPKVPRDESKRQKPQQQTWPDPNQTEHW